MILVRLISVDNVELSFKTGKKDGKCTDRKIRCTFQLLEKRQENKVICKIIGLFEYTEQEWILYQSEIKYSAGKDQRILS